MTDIKRLRDDWLDKKAIAAAAKKDEEDAKAALLDALSKLKGRKHNDGTYVTSVSQASKVVYDWEKIQERIGALRYNKLLKKVPDENLLDQAIAKGTIKASELKGCAEEKKNNPYPRVKEYKPDEEDDEEE